MSSTCYCVAIARLIDLDMYMSLGVDETAITSKGQADKHAFHIKFHPLPP